LSSLVVVDVVPSRSGSSPIVLSSPVTVSHHAIVAYHAVAIVVVVRHRPVSHRCSGRG
jgi:hypothetical protein